MNEALRFVAWLTAGGGGGMAGGVDLGWVFTSAGESGIVPTFCTLLPGDVEEERENSPQDGAPVWKTKEVIFKQRRPAVKFSPGNHRLFL